MTILTLNQELNLQKTHFRDLEELRTFIDLQLETEKNLDFRPLEKKETTLSLRAKMTATKKLPSSRFTNLTCRDANR